MDKLPSIKTERTVITILNPSLAELYFKYYNENRERLKKWEPARGEEFFTFEACMKRTESAHENFIEGKAVNFIIMNAESNEMLGACNFTNIVRGPMQACSLGFSVAGKYEGQGIMYEALKPAIEYMFGQAGLHRITANHLSENKRSEKLLIKLGFEKEGYARSYLKINGQWQDHVLNSLINEND